MTLSCAENESAPGGTIAGHVVASSDVRGADVSVWQLTPEGEPFELVGEAITNANGWFTVPMGESAGHILIVATGGVTTEPWAPDVEIPLEQELRAVLTDYRPGPAGTGRTVMISPFTTMAEALGHGKHAQGDRTYGDAMEFAYRLLGEHLRDIDLTDTPILRTAMKGHGLRAGERYGYAIAGLSGLAQAMAKEAHATARSVNTLTLTALLVEDATDPGALFDGVGPDGPLRVPGCEAPICALDSNTLRADLATGVLFHFLSSGPTSKDVTFDDARLVLESL